MNYNPEFYSQNGEDFLLWELFKGKPDGFYVEIGAFDGIHFSNSYFFEKHGWEGVCVEAHPKYFPLCKSNRPASICLNNACVGSGSSSSITFYSEELGLFSGITAEPLDVVSRRYNNRNTSFSGYDEVEVSTISLNDILRQHAPANNTVEFISVDTEGNEFDILKDFNFRRWDVGVFVVEANDDEHAKPIIRLMKRNGYVLSRVLSKNYFFAKAKKSITYLRYKRIVCQIAAGTHPVGQHVTKENERGLKIEDMSRWITPNVLCQQGNQPLWSLLDYFPPYVDTKEKSTRIVHVVNPYEAGEGSGAGKAQRLAYDSMRVARDFDEGEVELVSIQHRDEQDITPAGFHRGRVLDQFVTDLAEFQQPQLLPLLFDILERGAELAELDDFIVYTNSDIILMPFFYSAVRDFIEQGFDAINICRRTIGDHKIYQHRKNMACAEVGEIHPGSDCFVFSKKLYNQFIRNNACIGKKKIAKSLLLNMATAAERMLVLRNVNLTYHVGDDRDWGSPDFEDYTAYNSKELQKLVDQLGQVPERKRLLAAFNNTYWQPVNMRG